MIKIITDYNLIDEFKWKNFVANHPQGNVFQTPEMYNVYKHTNNYEPIILAIFKNGEIEGLMLAVIQKEFSGLLGFLTARSIIFGGPLISQDDSSNYNFILNEYNRIINKRAIYTQVRNFHAQNPEKKRIFHNNNFLFEDHLNILVDLTIGSDSLWKGIKRNRKDGINKAKKQGFDFEVKSKLDDINTFYNLLRNLFSSIQLPFPKKSFFNQIETEINTGTKWFLLKHSGRPLIILCALQSNKTLHAFYIGIFQDKNFLNQRPVDLFYWEVIKWASENGFNSFDWMGAGKPTEDYGVRTFKLQYGGELFNPGRYLNVHNKFLYKFGRAGLSFKQRIFK